MSTESPMSGAVLNPTDPKELSSRDILIREVASIYPYVQGRYGIDFASTIQTFEERGCRNEPIDCTGGSGSGLIIEMGNQTFAGLALDLIEVQQEIGTSHDERHMGATLNLEDNTLTFDLLTRALRTRELHPDFFAGKFIEFAINYFEQIRGYKVEKVKSLWLTDSDNYDAFFQIYNRRGKDTQFQQKGCKVMVEAAENTWAGKTLAKLGFDQIEEVRLFQYTRKYPLTSHYQKYDYVKAVSSRKEQP